MDSPWAVLHGVVGKVVVEGVLLGVAEIENEAFHYIENSSKVLKVTI